MDFWITDKSISYNKVKYIMRVFPVFLFPIAFPVCSRLTLPEGGSKHQLFKQQKLKKCYFYKSEVQAIGF